MTKRTNTSQKTKKGAAGGAVPNETLVIGSLEQFKAISHPLRQRIFERMASGTFTAKQVAEQLGEKPTRLYHHVAKLARAGLIQLVKTRPNRGATEKYYRAAGARIAIDPQAFGDANAASFQLAGGGIIDGVLTNLREDFAALMAEGKISGAANASGDEEEIEALLAQVEIRGNPAQLRKLRKQLDAFLAEVQAAAESEADGLGSDSPETRDDGEARRLVLAWYPPPGSAGTRSGD